MGFLFFGHGTQKLFGWFQGHGPEGTSGFFESLGYRPGKPMAIVAGLTGRLREHRAGRTRRRHLGVRYINALWAE